MVGGAEGRVVVYCPGQSVGERLQRIVQQPHEGGVCGPGSFRFITGGQGFGSGIPAVLESGEVAQRDRVQNAGRIRRRTWAGLRYAPSAPSSITKPTDSHKHWYIKRGQATTCHLSHEVCASDMTKSTEFNAMSMPKHIKGKVKRIGGECSICGKAVDISNVSSELRYLHTSVP